MKKFVKKINLSGNEQTLYRIKFADNGAAIFRGSRGYDENKCNSVAGTYALVDSDGNRFFVVTNFLEDKELSFPLGSGAYDHYSPDRLSEPSTYADKFLCTRCGHIIPAEQAETHDCGKNCNVCGTALVKGKCPACAKKALDRIYGYHCAPSELSTPRFLSPDKRAKKLHMGREFEFSASWSPDKRLRVAAKLNEIINPDVFNHNVRFENDGTTRNGWECISNPITLREWRKQADLWRAAYAYVASEGATLDNCGGHIHIDRNFFGNHDQSIEASVYMGIYLGKYWDTLFLPLSMRSTTEWCSPIKRGATESLFSFYLRFERQACRNSNHNTALNCGNSNTIELRFWGATLKTDEMLAHLDITQAFARWAKRINEKNFAKVQPADLFKWCSAPEITRKYVRAHITDSALLADIEHAIDVCDGTDYD